MSATHDIFLSYARTDRERVRPLVEAIERRGWRVWWDHDLAPGEHFRDVIGPALHAAKVVVVAWSRESIARDWVLDEAEDGRMRRILVPVLLDAVAPPLGFGQMHATDLTAWRGREDHSEFAKTIARIGSLLPARQPPPEPKIDRAGGAIALPDAAHARGRARYRATLSAIAIGLALALTSALVTYAISTSSRERAVLLGYCAFLLAVVGAPLAFAVTGRFIAWLLLGIFRSGVAFFGVVFVLIALFDPPRKDEAHSWLLFMIGLVVISLAPIWLWSAPVRGYIKARNSPAPGK